MNTITITTSIGKVAVDINTIAHITSRSNYCKVHFKDNKKVVVAKVLAWFELNMDQSKFLRINRSCLVNMETITKVICNKQATSLELSTQENFLISRRRLMKCKRVLGLK